MIKPTLCFLFLVASSMLSAQFPNILLDKSQAGYPPCEPSIAINPVNPKQIVGGAILDKVYISKNGGKKWTKRRLKSPLGVFGDPCIITDTAGRFYYFHLSNPGNKGWSDPELLDRIVCQVSEDGGFHWSEGASIGYNHPKDQDKEWAAYDATRDRVYTTWTQFDVYESKDTSHKSNILISWSDDHGANWTDPIAINERPGDCLDDDGTTEGAVPTIGPKGEVYVTWGLNDSLWFDRSTDGGKTWLKKRYLGSQHNLEAGPKLSWAFIAAMACRSTRCDLSPGPHRGTIYVNWSDQRNGETDTDIWLAKSTDGGKTWSPPLRVNNDAPGRQQFFPWMSIDPKTGYLYIVYYDRRRYHDTRTDVYLAWSDDGGESFSNVCISESPFIPGALNFFGDYNNISAFDGMIFPIWTRMEKGKTSVWTARIKHKKLAKMRPKQN